MPNPSYNHFNASIYCPVGNLIGIDDFDAFAERFAWIERHVKVGKVYLETYRGGQTIERAQMRRVQQFFAGRGIQTAGGITTETFATGEGGFAPCCYTDPDTRAHIQRIAELTAELFDEIILDDFYFTNCKCPSCIAAKGEQSWWSFRTGLMKEVSESLIVGAAKRVNPNVKMIIKYPNWYEHFQDAGYNLADEPQIFDGIYTGTETRNPMFTQQHLPKYLSYFNLRYMENIAPGRNGGGWFDPYECSYNLTSYAEQAMLTLLAKGRESMMFSLGSLLQPEFSLCVPVAGQVYADMDAYLGKLGKPTGTACYLPFHSRGEDFLHNYIGMLGIPLEPFPAYPAGAQSIFLTESAACDPDIIDKVKDSLMAGANVTVTSGFLAATKDRGFYDLAHVIPTGRKALVNRYAYSANGGVSFGGCIEAAKPILIEQLAFPTNDTWELCAAFGEDNSFPILLKTRYGHGKLFILTIPEDCGDLYHYPRPILHYIREAVNPHARVRLDAFAKVALFTYDNDTFALHSFQPYYENIAVSVEGAGAVLRDLVNGRDITGQSKGDKTEFTLRPAPGITMVFQIL